MLFYDSKTCLSKELFPGVTPTPIWGEHLMMSYVRFSFVDALVPTHQHPHEQMGMGLEGEFELIIDGEAQIIRAGIAYCIPGNTPHSARSLTENAYALDIFYPIREEYTQGLT
ncbi:cupin [Armatimonadota bacterium]|nr:cupin [Armatimonadota bacterium]